MQIVVLWRGLSLKEHKMKSAAGLAVTMAAVCSISTADAQTPRTYQASQIRDNCVRSYSDGAFCNTVLGMVQSRYGNTVTMMQWNAQVGVYRHKKRQGKL
jgi:hypothetical protein